MAKRKRLLSDAELKAKQRERGRKLYLSQKYQDDIELAQQEALNRGWIDYPKGENIATDNLMDLLNRFGNIYNQEYHKNGTYGDYPEMKSLKTNAINTFETAIHTASRNRLEEYLNKINAKLDTINNLLTELQSLYYDDDTDNGEEKGDLVQAREITSTLVNIILSI